jgi:hypothetical protein
MPSTRCVRACLSTPTCIGLSVTFGIVVVASVALGGIGCAFASLGLSPVSNTIYPDEYPYEIKMKYDCSAKYMRVMGPKEWWWGFFMQTLLVAVVLGLGALALLMLGVFATAIWACIKDAKEEYAREFTKYKKLDVPGDAPGDAGATKV